MNSLRNTLLSRPVFLFIALFLLIYTVLRGIRFPNIWSYTHYLFNYDYGVIKRGLIGAIVRKINIEYLYSYEFFVIFSLTILILSLLLLVRLILISLKSNDQYFYLSSLLFLSSSAIIFLSHTIGYFDHIGLLATLIILNINNFTYKYLITFPLSIFCLFVHEAFLIIFFPVIFISLLNGLHPKNNKLQIVGILIFSIASLATAFSLTEATISEGDTLAAFKKTQSRVSVDLRRDAYFVQKIDAVTSLERSYKESTFKRYKGIIRSLIITMPIAGMIAFITISYLIQLKAKTYIIVLAFLASFSPLLLHLVALDLHRFNTLVMTTCFLVLLAIKSDNSMPIKFFKGHLVIPPIVMSLLIIGIITNFRDFANIPLFGRYKIKNIPFEEHVVYIKDVFKP